MKPPKVRFRMPRTARLWAQGSTWRELILTIVATTISIILTFGTAYWLERQQRIEDRMMSAKMVMSNIESFSREIDKLSHEMASRDSIATWMLSLPVNSLDDIPVSEMVDPLNKLVALGFLSHDKTTENIFGNSIETWKNMGYDGVQFIDNVGKCFAEMNDIEKYWNDWVTECESVINDVISNMQPGEHTHTKLLSNNAFRQKLESYHVRQNWLEYASAYCRFLNDKNMALFKLDKQEIEDFTDMRTKDIQFGKEEPAVSDFRKPQIKKDSLYTLRPLQQHIDSILRGK